MNNIRNIHYFKNLDALRFFAFFAVFLSHAPLVPDEHFLYKILKLGFLGIDFFFVLSSFLITWIILKEQSTTGKFVWKNFMIRRILRIWPLYFLLIGLGIIIQGVVPDISTPGWTWYISFLANFYIISYGDNFLFFLTFLWSISVEEQFYFFWSILMKFIRNRLPVVFMALITASLLFRFWHLDNSKILYFHTLSILGNFGVGGLLAYVMFHKSRWAKIMEQIPKITTVIPYLLLGLSIVFYEQWFSSSVGIVVERLVFSVIFGAIILEQNFAKNSWIKWGDFSWLNYLGKISYGLYMYHGIVFTIISILHLDTPYHPTKNILLTLIALLSTILISAISFAYFERSFLKLKKRFYTFDK